MIDHARSFWSDEAGQDLLEYSVLICFFALATISITSQGFTSIANIWHKIDDRLAEGIARCCS